MSLERDIQSKNAGIELLGVTANAAAAFYSTTIIDTLGFRGLQIAVRPSRVLDDSPLVEAFRLTLQDSPDNVTFTAVAEEKILPTRHFDALGQLIINPVAPYVQTFGVTSVERYVRVGIECTVYNQVAATFGLAAILEAENKDFVGYDPNPGEPYVSTEP